MGLISQLGSSRELLVNLTLREIRGKFKRSILGQGWSLLNPIAQMAVFTVVFGLVLKAKPAPGDPSGIDVFALWIACGLIPWTFFSIAVTTGMSSLVSNAGLITKVYFPRWVLVVASTAAAASNFGFELIVLYVAVLLFGGNPLVFIPGILFFGLLLAIFGLGIALLLSVANVYFRDTEHLMAIVMQVWFYATPIVYPLSVVAAEAQNTSFPVLFFYRLNPMERFVTVFRNLLYDNRWPSLNDATACLVAAVAALAVGALVFSRVQSRLAEEL